MSGSGEPISFRLPPGEDEEFRRRADELKLAPGAYARLLVRQGVDAGPGIALLRRDIERQRRELHETAGLILRYLSAAPDARPTRENLRKYLDDIFQTRD